MMSASAKFSLLCLPCAGASATMYLRWRRLLPQWMHIVPVELPGRGTRMGEAFVDDYDTLVAKLCDEQGEAISGAFALFGHSMGALLAHGMARRLYASGAAQPRALLVSACAAPSRRNPERFAGKDNDVSLTADLRKQGGTPEEVFASAELMRITLDVLGADYRICRSYAHDKVAGAAPLPFPVHAFAGRQDDIDVDCIGAWSAETTGVFTLDAFDGGHFFIRQHETAFAEMLVRRLAQRS